jgi:hypothetical protein
MSRTLASIATWLPPEGEVLCRYDLAIALRFVDPFLDPALAVQPLTRQAIGDRFIVRIRSLNWEAQYKPADGTYRFIQSNSIPPLPNAAANFTVSVEPQKAATARYFVPGPLSISLPIQGGPFTTPQQQVAAYLLEVEAFPSPLFRAPAGETCVRGTVVDNAGAPRANVQLELFDPANSPPNVLFTRTDANGFFAYRLPWLKRPTPIPASPNLGVNMAFANISVTPHPPGNSTRASFAYGETTSVAIQAF